QGCARLSARVHPGFGPAGGRGSARVALRSRLGQWHANGGCASSVGMEPGGHKCRKPGDGRKRDCVPRLTPADFRDDAYGRTAQQQLLTFTSTTPRSPLSQEQLEAAHCWEAKDEVSAGPP